MLTLVLFNLALIAGIVVGLILCKKFAKSDKSKFIILLVVAIMTVLCHYSSLLYHAILDGSQMAYLKSNPNLILPIYPCNVIMWSCLILGFLKNKNTKFAQFLVDMIFWFGIISCLVGMFANVEFINDPTLANFDTTKGIVAHAIMLFNVLLLPVLGFVKINLLQNIKNIILSVLLMFVIGLYCNLVFTVLCSAETAYQVNSMFLIHSPFESIPYLTFPIIASVAVVAYFFIFHICEFFKYPKGKRWFNRLRKGKKK